jgi:hypothetical protein
MNEEKLYTEEDLRKAFEAGREQDFNNTKWEQHPQFKNVKHWDSRKFPTWEHYKLFIQPHKLINHE